MQQELTKMLPEVGTNAGSKSSKYNKHFTQMPVEFDPNPYSFQEKLKFFGSEITVLHK
ncbi:MAG: hypothetical protein LUH22_06275 [Bacteroides sp.]|nr:hypothetical protein [Bacteroides sp.]